MNPPPSLAHKNVRRDNEFIELAKYSEINDCK